MVLGSLLLCLGLIAFSMTNFHRELITLHTCAILLNHVLVQVNGSVLQALERIPGRTPVLSKSSISRHQLSGVLVALLAGFFSVQHHELPQIPDTETSAIAAFRLF